MRKWVRSAGSAKSRWRGSEAVPKLEDTLAGAKTSLLAAIAVDDHEAVGPALSEYLQLFEAAVASEGLTLDESSWWQRAASAPEQPH